jgi:hypothetical protein
MVRERDDGGLELEVPARRLGWILGGALLVFGLLGALAALRARASAGWAPFVFSAMLSGLGALTLSQSRGLRAVIDRGRKTLSAQPLGLFGAGALREVSLGDIREVALLGSSTSVSLYVHWGEVDDMFVGRFLAEPAQRAELQRWIGALRKASPSATFEPRAELESGWLR